LNYKLFTNEDASKSRQLKAFILDFTPSLRILTILVAQSDLRLVKILLLLHQLVLTFATSHHFMEG